MNYRDQIKLESGRLVTRRWFFKECAAGLGSIALASLLNGRTPGAAEPQSAPGNGRHPNNPLAPKRPPFAAKAKRVIYLFHAGGPSQLDLFDYKPGLVKYNGQPVPPEFTRGINYAFIRPDAGLYASEFNFARHGQSGAELSRAWTHLPSVADDLTIVRSMMTDAINHAPGQVFMQTGSIQFGRPSFGAWVTYGLGSETEDLPAYVVLSSGGGTSGGAANWGCGFLPTVYQGVPFQRTGPPILSLQNPRGVTREMQRRSLDTLKELNEEHLAVTGDPETATRINAFEMAFRMQDSGPELMDFSKESKSTLELYGAEPGKASYANNCLLARRLVERGVRFVQLNHEAWDHHSEVAKGVRGQMAQVDRATTALIVDLKQRGLLNDTIVIWGGEFGRTPMVESDPDAKRSLGRDHHNQAFSLFVAGGGFKPGLTLGRTDEFGFNVVEDPVHVHDLHATLLRLLGFDHTKLTYRYQGRDFRLTDVHGLVIDKLLA
ncbi:MAG TPA: DUF1501 domain-containing protein [Blastocatellia bacterium]|nr:DUF1501 domain-containing protein [Blastocatellia bacterium]